MSNLSGSSVPSSTGTGGTIINNTTIIENFQITGDITTPCLKTDPEEFSTNADINSSLSTTNYTTSTLDTPYKFSTFYTCTPNTSGQISIINVPANTSYEWNITATSLLQTQINPSIDINFPYTLNFQTAYSNLPVTPGETYLANSRPAIGEFSNADLYASSDGGHTYTLQNVPIYYVCSEPSNYSFPNTQLTNSVGPTTIFQIVIPTSATATIWKLCLGLIYYFTDASQFDPFITLNFVFNNNYGETVADSIPQPSQIANNTSIKSGPVNAEIGVTLVNQLTYNKLVPRYQWHWNAVTTAQTYTINHNLNMDSEEPIHYRIVFSTSPTGVFPLIEVTQQSNVYGMMYVNPNTIQLLTANDYITSGINGQYSTGYWNVYIY